MVLSQFVAVVMLNKCLHFHEICFDIKVMANIKVFHLSFQTKVKVQMSRSQSKSIDGKALSHGMHM